MVEEPPPPSDAAAGGRPGRRTDTTAPRRARERALKILFQADVRGVAPEVILARVEEEPGARAMLDEVDDLTDEQELLAGSGTRAAGPRSRPRSPAPIDGFTRSLVLGVAEHREEIDELVSRFARGWRIARMPVVDRNVLRLASFELQHGDTPAAVAINEAVELARSLSTDDSGRYVNGVLESVRRYLDRT